MGHNCFPTGRCHFSGVNNAVQVVHTNTHASKARSVVLTPLHLYPLAGGLKRNRVVVGCVASWDENETI